MEYWKLRIHTDDIDKVEDVLKKYATSYVVSFETAQREHIHSYLETTQKEATIRNKLRKTFGSGNQTYSLKELDEEKPIEYLRYVVKDGLYRHNLPQDLIDKAIESDLQVKEGMKEKKKSKKTQLVLIRERYFNKRVKNHLGVEEDFKDYTLSYVLDSVMEYYEESDILIREFQLVSLIQTLSLKYVKGYKTKFRSRLLDKVDPHHLAY